jgi:hypothetical protein
VEPLGINSGAAIAAVIGSLAEMHDVGAHAPWLAGLSPKGLCW